MTSCVKYLDVKASHGSAVILIASVWGAKLKREIGIHKNLGKIISFVHVTFPGADCVKN